MRIAGCVAAAVVIGVAIAAFASVVVADDESDRIVITRPGVVFHKVGAGDARGRSVEKAVDAALEGGYTPCRVCFGKELGSTQIDTRGLAHAGTSISLGEATSTIPAPLESTVTQPFGLEFRTGQQLHIKCDTLGNPYDLPETRKFGTAHRAFEHRGLTRDRRGD